PIGSFFGERMIEMPSKLRVDLQTKKKMKALATPPVSGSLDRQASLLGGWAPIGRPTSGAGLSVMSHASIAPVTSGATTNERARRTHPSQVRRRRSKV